MEAHKNQVRKGSAIPYIYHPMGVARLLMETGYEEVLILAALLHDTIEDTSVEVADLVKHFGKKVSGLVVTVSEISKKYSWQERKDEMIARLKEAPLDSLRLSIADKIDNLDSIKRDLKIIGSAIWSRFHASKEKQAWYYSEMRKIYLNRLCTPQDIALFQFFDRLFNEIF